MKNALSQLFLMAVFTLLSGCVSSSYYRFSPLNAEIKGEKPVIVLNDLSKLDNTQLLSDCDAALHQKSATLQLIVNRLNCAIEILQRVSFDAGSYSLALSAYNQALLALIVQQRKSLPEALKVVFPVTSEFILVAEMQARDNRLQPAILGDIGVPITIKNDDVSNGDGAPYSHASAYQSRTLLVDSMNVKNGALHIRLRQINPYTAGNLKIGKHRFTYRYSTGAAYLALLEKSDMDRYSWLGFVCAEKVESRHGVFVITPLSKEKIPIIMIHGLNSDPLIWRHMTMYLLNQKHFEDHYQIWHVFYPTGKTPFHAAWQIRENLQALVDNLNAPSLAENAVYIGHSMGGIVSKLLSIDSGAALWDETFLVPAETFNATEYPLHNLLIFEPVFAQNQVFFLETPHRGSAIASSIIGNLGSWLVSLPTRLKDSLADFLELLGNENIQPDMRPFLADMEPNSIKILRPGHPLMQKLLSLQVSGKKFSIIGSNGSPGCNIPCECDHVTDGIVTFSSAYLPDAIKTVVIESNHDSFQSDAAIQFVGDNLEFSIN